MDDNNDINLDTEFKRYLQIMRPYLGQLVDQDVIEICNAWIQRLSDCKDHEKPLRNKYIFTLCYQLARGVIDDPFIKCPDKDALQPFSEFNSDDSSTEVEYVVIDAEEPSTKIIFNNKKAERSDTDDLSQIDQASQCNRDKSDDSKSKQNKSSFKQSVYCYTCPEVMRYCTEYDQPEDGYESRASNLIMRLREIKKQNALLQNELVALKEESKINQEEFSDEHILKVDNATSALIRANESSATVRSLKFKLQEVQDSRNNLIETIGSLQEKLDNFEEMKRNEIADIEAKYKLEIIQVRTVAREEIKNTYDNKIEELKRHYENTIEQIQENAKQEIQNLLKTKDDIILEKNKEISIKDNEITRLKNQMEDHKEHVHVMLGKFLEKPFEDYSSESMKVKARQLEKRLNRMEKSKTKFAKEYEARFAHLQREKHLAECSLQLQLVRQRAQVVNEVTDENQAELTSALEKLETKYKEIVANVQATAIQRRMQDDIALDAILQATNAPNEYIHSESVNRSHGINRNQFPKTRNQNREGNHSCDTQISSLLRGNKVGNIIVNKSFGEDSVIAGYCLDGERMGELFERVYIPQRDTGDGNLKK